MKSNIRILAFRTIKISILIYGLCLNPEISAQNEENVPNYLNTPEILSNKVQAKLIEAIHSGDRSLEEIANGPTISSNWTVYSDRAENTLRGTPAGLENGQQLKFMQHVIVKDVKRKKGHNWLHVYSRIYKPEEEKLEKHKERGWIRADRVLLTHYAVLSNKHKLTKKRIALYSLDHGKESDQKPDQIDYDYYAKPKQADRINSTNALKIFFEMKEVGAYVLLATVDELDGDNVKGEVLGWMEKAKTTKWNTRICLEPSYGRRRKKRFENIKEYETFKLPVFDDEDELKKFKDVNRAPEKHIFQTYEIRKNRMIPNNIRLPVMDNISKTNKQVVSVANISTEDRNNAAKIDKKLSKLKNKKEAVNILFVIDGTESMTDYYPPIRKSIEQTIENNPFSATGMKIRFGLAIYRDYADGNKKFNLTPLTSDHEKIIKELHKVETGSKDDDLPEAQYQGMKKGLKQAGFDRKNSNVVVLVGDAGNHRPDPKDHTKKEVINQLYGKRASLIAFQVVNGAHLTFDVFNHNVAGYLRNAANQYVKSPSDVKLKKTKLANTYKLAYSGFSRKDKSMFMFGRFTYAASDQKIMEPALLNKNIVNALQDYLNMVNISITQIQNLRANKGSEKGTGKIDEEMKRFLKLNDYTPEEIRFLNRIGKFTKRGYVSTRYYGKKNAFIPVVYLTENQKTKLDNILRELTRGGMSVTEQQKALQNALLEQCSDMLGNESRDVILDYTMDEIWNIILKVPFEGQKKIKDKKLREIQSMNRDDFEEFYSVFEESAKKFIRKSYRDSRYELGDQYIYWIPLKDIPGNVK